MITDRGEYTVERFEALVPMEDLLENYFDFPATLEKCRQCPGFGQTWSCPELDFDPREFLSGYSSLRFIVDKVNNSGADTPEKAQEWLFKEKHFFDRNMLEIESSIPGSCALAAQECQECKKCARLSGQPCVHPEIMRFGLEAIGCFPVKLVKDKLGFDILWSDGTSVPDYYLLVAGILLP